MAALAYNSAMAFLITETFGYPTSDQSSAATEQRSSQTCPFVHKECWKKFKAGGRISGVCAVKPQSSDEVIVCPDRLYAEQFLILREVVSATFGPDMNLIGPSDVSTSHGEPNRVVAFGKRWGKEIRIPKHVIEGYPRKKGSFSSADWILAHIDNLGNVIEFVPVEVQSMDTTGSYQSLWYELYGLDLPDGCKSTAPNINWENVNKRIIPQLLTKGNVFRREPLCQKGMFFVCPSPVYKKLIERLGAKLSEFPMQSGALTFRYYDLAQSSEPGQFRSLISQGQFTTTIENLKEAFNSTLNLPEMGIVAERLQSALRLAAHVNATAQGAAVGG
jgi:hypothetical protein